MKSGKSIQARKNAPARRAKERKQTWRARKPLAAELRPDVAGEPPMQPPQHRDAAVVVATRARWLLTPLIAAVMADAVAVATTPGCQD